MKYKYCNTARHFFLYILILTSILMVLHFWSQSNFLLSMLLSPLHGDVEMNPEPSLFLRKAFQLSLESQ